MTPDAPVRMGDRTTERLFSYVNCQARVPKDHPLRAARRHRNGGAVAGV